MRLRRPKPPRCVNCTHCRVQGTGAKLRAWCRLGIWTTYPDRPRARPRPFFYRALRQLFSPQHRRLSDIARHCPYFEDAGTGKTSLPLGELWGVRFLGKPD